MAAINTRSSTELLTRSKRYHYDHTDVTDQTNTNYSPQKILTEPAANSAGDSKVGVVYYLSRNGQLQHPHFMEVFLSSSHGLYLRDVMTRLNFLRGNGMAKMYSWSSKRRYKNGYVWQDLSENDLIHPTNNKDEYTLKGSELLQSSSSFRLCETASSRNLPEPKYSDEDSNIPTTIRRRNQSWSSFDNPQEYIVYKSESSRYFAGIAASDAATQTEDRRNVRRDGEVRESNAVELSREEVSPPPSNSSSEVKEGVRGLIDVDHDLGNGDRPVKQLSGRMTASKVLMQLVSCGSASVKDFGSMKNRGV